MVVGSVTTALSTRPSLLKSASATALIMLRLSSVSIIDRLLSERAFMIRSLSGLSYTPNDSGFHHSVRRPRRDRAKNLPNHFAGEVGRLAGEGGCWAKLCRRYAAQ